MSSEHPLRARVGVAPATREQEPLLANLLELYIHDLSALFDVPLLVHVDDRVAGFALIARGSRVSGDPLVWDVSEFFILRGYRKQRIGTTVARELWRRFRGPWEVRVLERNTPALAFWTKAIAACSTGRVDEATVELQGKRWRVFSFHAP